MAMLPAVYKLRVLKYLSDPMEMSEETKSAWIQHWIELGLEPLEQSITSYGRNG